MVLFRYRTYAYDNFKLSAPYAQGHALKQAVIAPSMLSLLYPPKSEGALEGYSREAFFSDLVNEVCHESCSFQNTSTKVFMKCEKDIRGCFAAGAKRVSIDFTECDIPYSYLINLMIIGTEDGWRTRKMHVTHGQTMTSSRPSLTSIIGQRLWQLTYYTF